MCLGEGKTPRDRRSYIDSPQHQVHSSSSCCSCEFILVHLIHPSKFGLGFEKTVYGVVSVPIDSNLQFTPQYLHHDWRFQFVRVNQNGRLRIWLEKFTIDEGICKRSPGASLAISQWTIGKIFYG